MADGKHLLDLIGLAAGDGTVLELEAHGPDAEEAVTALADLISARFPTRPRRPRSHEGRAGGHRRMATSEVQPEIHIPEGRR